MAPDEGPHFAGEVERFGLYGNCHDRLLIKRSTNLRPRPLPAQGKSDGGKSRMYTQDAVGPLTYSSAACYFVRFSASVRRKANGLVARKWNSNSRSRMVRALRRVQPLG